MITIQELLQYHRPSHSRVQMDNAITRKTGNTYYGMFKQALRELSDRWTGMRAAAIDLLELEYQLAEPEDSEISSPFRRMRLKLRHEELIRGMTAAAREVITFYEQAVALRKKLPDNLSDETIEQLELDYWIHWHKKQMALEIEVNGKVSLNTLDQVLALPVPARDDLLGWRENRTGLKNFLVTEAVTEMPPVERLGLTIRQVLDDLKSQKPLQLKC